MCRRDPWSEVSSVLHEPAAHTAGITRSLRYRPMPPAPTIPALSTTASAGTAGSRTTSPRRLRVALVITATLAALIGAGVLHTANQRAIEEARQALLAQQAPPPPPPKTAKVLDAVRAMKLVTSEIKTTVTAQSYDFSWRGDVRAIVGAPATLLYGTDLSELRADAVRFGPFTGQYLITVPPPQRIATEVFPSSEETKVEVGWLRTRGGAGEYHLGLARRGLADEARQLILTPHDEATVRETTRQQVAQVVKSIVGLTPIRVRFTDEPMPRDDDQPPAQAAMSEMGDAERVGEVERVGGIERVGAPPSELPR